MSAGPMTGNAPPPDAAPARQRRIWGERIVVLAATAAALGISQTRLALGQAAGTSIDGLAARRGVSVERVRAVALSAADPLLDEAVRSGALSDGDRRRLRWRLRELGVV